MGIRNLYYQVYMEFDCDVPLSVIRAKIINALVPIEELIIQSHQLVIYKDQRNVEVKIGHGDAWVQISTTDINLTRALLETIMNVLGISEEEKEKENES